MATNELKSLVAFGLAVGELVSGLLNGVGIGDLGAALKASKLAGPALHGASAALDEYVNMSDEEAVQLEAFVKSEFNVSDSAVEEVITVALNALIELHDLVKLVFGGK